MLISYAPYFDAFGPERVLPVFFERLTAAPQAELERIAEFLGHEHTAAWSEERPDQNRSYERLRTSRLRDAIVFAPGVSWLRRNLVPKPIRNSVKSLWKLPTKPVLSAATEARLVEVFDQDLQLLGNWLGVPLSCKRFRDVVSHEPLKWHPNLGDTLAAESTRRGALA